MSASPIRSHIGVCVCVWCSRKDDDFWHSPAHALMGPRSRHTRATTTTASGGATEPLRSVALHAPPPAWMSYLHFCWYSCARARCRLVCVCVCRENIRVPQSLQTRKTRGRQRERASLVDCDECSCDILRMFCVRTHSHTIPIYGPSSREIILTAFYSQICSHMCLHITTPRHIPKDMIRCFIFFIHV